MTRNRQIRSAGSATPNSVALEQYAPKLYRYLARRLRQSQDIEDLVQYVYQRFLQSPRHELVRQPEAYLYRIAANVINEWSLHKRREIVSFDSDAVEEMTERPAETSVWTDDVGDQYATQQQLQRILAQVPLQYRVVFLMNVRDGLTCQEIAGQLGITALTAKKYLSRALAYCRSAHWSR
jgi:RNA polymerase sigma-70 factor (ECF subfamily)